MGLQDMELAKLNVQFVRQVANGKQNPGAGAGWLVELQLWRLGITAEKERRYTTVTVSRRGIHRALAVLLTHADNEGRHQPHQEMKAMKEKKVFLFVASVALLGCLSIFAYFFGWPAYQEAQAAKDAEKKIAAAHEKVAAELRDPSSAQFRGSKVDFSGGVCGQVNGKNAFGAYVGFRWFYAKDSEVMIDHPDAPIKVAEIMCQGK